MNSGTHKTVEPGARYHKLVVGDFVGFDSRRNALFECTCDCGNKKPIALMKLKRGMVKSCGCLPAERMKTLSSTLAVDESGNRYGSLTVLERIGKSSHGGSFLYKCRCDCGSIREFDTNDLRTGSWTTCGAYKCLTPEIREALNEVQEPEFAAKNAYFSGHFDGEGCVTIAKRNTYPAVVIRVSAVYKPVIMDYLAYFGGTVHKIKPSVERRGRVQWGWNLMSIAGTIRFIRRIVPYSKEKQSQLALALEYLVERVDLPIYNAGNELRSKLPALIEKLHELKRYEFLN